MSVDVSVFIWGPVLSSSVYSSVDNVYKCMCVNQSALLCFDVVTSGSWISEY